MAKEKQFVDGTEIASGLVGDNEIKVLGSCCLAPMWRRSSMTPSSDFVTYEAERSKDYPPNITDQTHALSIAEQIKVGQAQVRNDDSVDQYDFNPGQRDDGRDAVGVYEYSEPAERFEAERDVASSIQNEIQLQQFAAEKRLQSLKQQKQDEVKKAESDKNGPDKGPSLKSE